MKKIILFYPLCLLLSSCEIKNNGDIGLSGLGWGIVLCVVVLFFYVFFYVLSTTENEKQKSKSRMKKTGMDYSQFIKVGTYVGGHPDLDETLNEVYVREENGNLVLYQIPIFRVSMPRRIGRSAIEIESIRNITIEDSTSIEKSVTLGRVLLVGIFALAWKKKKKNEFAFVVIEWKGGKFEHSTSFSFEGKDAMQIANAARNKLIKICS